MRLITICSLAGSAVLGLAAMLVAKVAIPAAHADRAVAAPLQSMEPTRPVVVAAHAIGYGARLDASQLKVARYRPDALPAGAFSSIAEVLGQDGGAAPVALVAIGEREAILPAKLSGPGGRASVAAEIAPGLRAYAIRVSDVTGVGGHALPGDRVDVVLTRNLAPDGKDRRLVSQVVIQNVRVLGVDLNADPTSNKPAPPQTATLEVSVEAAQKLALASELGALSLALRRAGAGDLEPIRPVSASDLGAAPARAEIGSEGVRRAGPSARRPPIVVVEGDGASKPTAKASGA